MLKNFYAAFLTCLLAALCSSCYRMPTEEDYSLIPYTNNPDYTHERAPGMPGMGY